MRILQKALCELRLATLRWQKQPPPTAPAAQEPVTEEPAEPLAEVELADEDFALSGMCPVCAAPSRFTGFTDNPRESGRCSNCQSFNRQRQMAHTIRQQCGLSDAEGWHFPPGFAIYNTETTGALHLQLAELPGYVCSEYFGDAYKSGDMVEGRRHEDLQALSFSDNSLDLVMSSDVMEHMPEPYAAHAEIFRVLKPGGRHIFTVPYSRLLAVDQVRAKIVDGEIVYLEEKAFHGDPVRPDEGVLVWTIFGLNMLDRLRSIGFEASEWDFDEPTHGIVGPGALTFEAKKPLAA